MKITRIECEQYPSGTYGLLLDDGRIEVVAGGLLDPVRRTGDVVEPHAVTKYLPVVQPPNLLAIGLNYSDHAKETGAALPKEPLLFIKATTTVVAHGDTIFLPKIAPSSVDYEAELCVVIGKAAKDVPKETALDHVFGYACGNDVSARDCQIGDGQWARGKSFDTFAPIGPCVVTDLDPGNLRIEARLNGQTMQASSTSMLVFDVPTLVSHLSRCMTLLPGTVIMTGTPHGVGMSRSPQVFMKAGDTIEIEIEGIGVLRNSVALAEA